MADCDDWRCIPYVYLCSDMAQWFGQIIIVVAPKILLFSSLRRIYVTVILFFLIQIPPRHLCSSFKSTYIVRCYQKGPDDGNKALCSLLLCEKFGIVEMVSNTYSKCDMRLIV